METMKDTTIIKLALVSALAVMGVMMMAVIESTIITQQADAAPPPVKGCRNSLAANASQGNCVQGIR